MRKYIFLSLLLILAACTHGNSDNLVSASDNYSTKKSENITQETAKDSNISNTQVYDRKQIKQGTVRFQTNDLEKTRAHILAAVKQANAYIEMDEANERNENYQNHLVIRVPIQSFDTLLEQILSGVKRVDYKNVEVEDVTQRYIDLDTRIKTKKELEQRYIQLLKKANSVSDILSIEKEINVLRGDIESTEKQLQYLEKRVAFSTLSVTFYTQKSGEGFGYKFKNALIDGWNNLLWFIVQLANLWAIILFVVVIWFAIRRLRKIYGSKKHKNPPSIK